MNNELQAKKPSFSMMITSSGYQKMINNAIKDPKRASRFVSGIVSAVTTNQALQDCESSSILSAALLGESLGLSPSPQLAQYYIVPFNDKKSGTKKGEFILGYRGLVQLAIRSGQYKVLNVFSIKEGEFYGWNPFTEELDIRIDESGDRDNLPTVGYAATFTTMSGFRKTIYWSKDKMLYHADRYSPAFSREATSGRYPKVSFADYESGNYPKKDEWLYSSFWYKDFDGMACKTMLRQIISKWGPMSTEMETAIEIDVKQDADPDYFSVDDAPEFSQVEPPADAPIDRQDEQNESVPEQVNLDEL